ncbi:MAG: hypothetical protein PWQ82_337 [Thermosediminibacterales bacterium]|nr:hypothetical protein [Thermosediminibacterales bacterium]MDK2835708.1 hypothetical protein [Thermosediminibacterales bacterium]
MEHLKSILNKSLKKVRFNSKYRLSSLLVSWDDIIGKRLSENTCPSFIRGKTLFINVPNSMWAHSLSFMKLELIQKINRFYGETVIKDIKFQYGSIYNNNKKISIDSDPYNTRNNVITELNENEIEKIDMLLKEVNIDSKLKHRLKKLMITHYMSKKAQKTESDIDKSKYM